MNDRFKFRAYNKESKRIYPVRELGFMRDTLEMGHICLDKPGNDYYGIEIENVEEYIVMQCTGLKDKNGKLIYEGDIVKTMGNREATGYGVVEYLQSGCRFYVNGYLDNPSPYHPRKKGELYHPLQEWLCKEVIGNIYENPELLEVNNANI